MNLKFLYGDKSRISTDITPFNEGSFYVTHDGDMCVDMNTGTGNQRIQLTLDVNAFRSEIISAIYPVGSIYISTTSTDPATLFGLGTWEKIEDTFLLAAGAKYANGTTGGEVDHVLTVEELPPHAHSFPNAIITKSTDGGTLQLGTSGYFISTSNFLTTDTTAEIGEGKAHNNMPPYLAVNVWKRIE